MTSKSELEKLVKDIESKEKYLNLLSKSSFYDWHPLLQDLN